MQDPNPLPWGAENRFQAHFIVRKDTGRAVTNYLAKTKHNEQLKGNRLKLIIGMMSIALLGLIAVQIYWIKNAIDLEEKLFDYNVNDAMHSVVKGISRHESAEYVVHKLIKPDTDDVFVFRSDITNEEDSGYKEKKTWISSYNYEHRTNP